MRLIIISNRSPASIVKENGGYRYVESAGGLASGLRTLTEKMKDDKSSYEETLWLGWPGAAVSEQDQEKVKKEMREQFGTSCVFISEELMDKFYLGFCNNTIWPLFHYFPVYTSYETEYWEVYKTVNEIFCNALADVYHPGDVIWIHDYHLMLLPTMIREKIPGATIGFFLHIPFPSYEVYRLLPSKWRKQILEGVYGSDLVGFHTHDYRSYFLQSSLRILGTEDNMGEVMFNNRMVKVDSFPMGIDYQKYSTAVKSRVVKIEKRKLEKTFGRLKLILSLDRQDYSKGILNRMIGYELFLDRYPEWKEKVSMMMVVVPSRIGVEHYQVTKSQIDELVGRINGNHGTMQWNPIIYHYRALSFEELIAVYSFSDVALITPLRDGMNLIAKEFIATRTRKDGVLILSEMAGSADELAEAIIINPNNLEEICESLAQALKINKDDQANRITIMQKRLMSYDIFKWSNDFLTSLDTVKKEQERLDAKFLRASERESLISHFKDAGSRILFLDYDGSLVPFTDRPEAAQPNKSVLTLLANLASIENTEVVLVSGRDRETLEQWFGDLPISIVAEHGIFLKEADGEWKSIRPVRKNWKKKITPVFKAFAEKLPGAFIEDKEYSLAFHYRKADSQLASLRVNELVGYLMNLISNLDVQILQGNMVLELRNGGIDKGVAAMHWLGLRKSEFILAIGDDKTDEDLFRAMPPEAYSIKVGHMPSYARFNLDNHIEVTKLLNELLEQKEYKSSVGAAQSGPDIPGQKIP